MLVLILFIGFILLTFFVAIIFILAVCTKTYICFFLIVAEQIWINTGWTNKEPFQSMILEGFCVRLLIWNLHCVG